ncbi:hypothetical protein [Thalassolituus sp.]|uniref:hypothetical protein n=1 Tax=Thalassolituus sp. TaxID=2030822 RepID=UPI00351245DB
MNRKFIDLVRKNKIAPPTKPGFSADKWKKSWEKVCEKTDECRSVYEAGLVFGEIFSEYRRLLAELYSYVPDTTNERLLRLFVAITNHDREVLFRTAVAQIRNNLPASSYSQIVSNNALGNELTIEEVEHACVDGLSKAIYSAVNRIRNGEEIEGKKKFMDEIDFVMKESVISQFYGFLEDYWAAILWRGYHFEFKDCDNRKILIKQPCTSEETSLEISQFRKLRLSSQGIPYLNDPEVLQYFDLDRCMYPKKEGRKKKVLARALGREPNEIRILNANFRFKSIFLKEEFPEYYFSGLVNSSFTLNDVLEVYRCLILYAHKCVSKYPKNDAITSFNKACEFCHTIGRNELVSGLNAATGIPRVKLEDILNFLTFDGSSRKDMWANPLISADGEFLIASSVLLTPTIMRSFEHWIVEAGFDLGDKGTKYESNSLKELSTIIKDCDFSEIVSKPYSKRFKFSNQEEEIDLLIKVGSKILVGEIKSIVTTDSPISSYRTLSTLKKAARQAVRKVEFVKNNCLGVFAEAGWSFSDGIDYEYIPLILNSSGVYVGLEVDGVPVVDFRILGAYFSSPVVPLISSQGGNGSTVHFAYYELYSNKNEFEKNISIYLSNPPQINDSSDDFSYKSFELPALTEKLPDIVFERLVYKSASAKERVDRLSEFPLIKSEDYDEFMKENHILM